MVPEETKKVGEDLKEQALKAWEFVRKNPVIIVVAGVAVALAGGALMIFAPKKIEEKQKEKFDE